MNSFIHSYSFIKVVGQTATTWHAWK